MAEGCCWSMSSPRRTPRAGSRAIRVPTTLGVILRRASLSNANGQHGQQNGQPGRCRQDSRSQVAGGLLDADDGGRHGSDGHGA